MAKGPTTPARLDKDRTAKPKTRIVNHPKQGHCVGPGAPLRKPELEDTTTKKRTRLTEDALINLMMKTEQTTDDIIVETLEMCLRDHTISTEILFGSDVVTDEIDLEQVRARVTRSFIKHALKLVDHAIETVQDVYDL